MQLIRIFLIFLFLFSFAYSQENPNTIDKPTLVDFLFNYYQQDGDHSAVTGGVGSQELTNLEPLFIINIPMAENNLSITAGIDMYTSASSDNIDPSVSGASGGDSRTHIDLGYTFNKPENELSYGFSLGGSVEFDYRSLSMGANWSKGFYRGNSSIALSGKVYFDNISLIYPIELREEYNDGNGSDSRNTYDLSATYSQVLSKKSQISLNLQAIYQTGYLSTPFHRVFFNNNPVAKIETFPDTRLKLPIGLRFNYYLNDTFILKTYYRYYTDDFGMRAQTASIEVPIRLNQSFTLSPGFRYHTQGGTIYFYEFGQAEEGIDYYTSDYDLSAFDSQKYGLALRYYPISGISDFNMPLINSFTNLKRIDFKAAYYVRSNGFNAISISMGISFSMW